MPPPSFSSRPPMPVRIRSCLLALFRLINLFRLEYGSPQTLRNFGLRLHFDPLLSNGEWVKVMGVRRSSHLRNLDFSRPHFHCKRVFLKRVALQSILLQRSLTTDTFLKS